MERIKTLAEIELFSGEKMRRTPFVSGYRPLFDFVGAQTKISGKIDLINQSEFAPGGTGLVNITFIKGMINNNYFMVGQPFTFGEGANVLGKGKILDVLYTDKVI